MVRIAYILIATMASLPDAKTEAARRGLFIVGWLALGLVAISILFLLMLAWRRSVRRHTAKKRNISPREDPWLEAGKRAEPETRYVTLGPDGNDASHPASGDAEEPREGSWDVDPATAASSAGGLPGTDRPVALITGGARRVGLAIAESLARSGCDLILTYNASVDAARRASELLMARGASVRLLRVDLSDSASVESVGAKLAAELPRLDILVHNASVYASSPLDHLNAETATLFWRVNALAPLLLTRHLAPLLARSQRHGGGSVVAMADIHAMGRPRKGFAAYLMSKAALVEMIQGLSRELAPAVRVNGVAPGVVAWPEEGADSDAGFQKAYIARVPLERAGTPEDAAEVVRWLALDAHYVTGQIVRVDGGRWLA